jgi:hypothetical protein
MFKLLQYYKYFIQVYIVANVELIIYLTFFVKKVSCTELIEEEDPLNVFFVRQHNTRIELLRDIIGTSPDIKVELLQNILRTLNTATVDTPEFSDPFSDAISDALVNENHLCDIRSYFIAILLFLGFSCFGLLWFKFPIIFLPLFYYQQQIYSILTLAEKNPENYFDIISQCYQQLVDDGVIQDIDE